MGAFILINLDFTVIKDLTSAKFKFLICVRVKYDVLQPNLLTKQRPRNQLHESVIVIKGHF